MPKENINYSNTIIYKIYCKDDTITDIYVGHTTHFIQRKYQHKILSNESNNNLKIYKTIRENGGWDNWSMVEIAIYNCKNSTEARIKEQIHYEKLHATLNSCAPYIDKTKYFCVECDLQCSGPKLFNNHINCISHNKNIINPNNEPKFRCEFCDYRTSKKSSYVNHIASAKHKRITNELQIGQKDDKTMPDTIETFICSCGKQYQHRQGLWRHKKKCNKKESDIEESDIEESDIEEPNAKELIQYLLKENSEFKQLMLDQNKYMQEQNKHIFELVKNYGTKE